MKKKLLVIGMCAVMAFSMTACSSKEDSKETTKTEATSAAEEESLAEGMNEKDKDVDADSEVTTLADYKALSVKASEIEISDEDVTSSIRSILSGHMVDKGTVTEDDIVEIDYVGKMDGEEFEGGTAEGQKLDIANSTYISGFAEGLVGVKVGKTVTLNLKFPDKYSNKPEYAGKDVQFDVTVKKHLPELTDEFVAKTLKVEYESTTVEELKQYVTRQMILSNKYNLIWSDYVSSCVTNNSKTEIQDIVDKGISYYESYVKSTQGTDLESYLTSNGSTLDSFKQELTSQARVSVKEKAILAAIAKAEKLEVTDADYEKEVNYYMETNGYESQEEFESEYDVDEVKSNILKYKVIEWVCDNLNVVESEESSETETTAEATTE